MTALTGHPGEGSEQSKTTLLAERVIPIQVAGLGGKAMLAIASQRAATRLLQIQFGVGLLGVVDAPQHTGLYLLEKLFPTPLLLAPRPADTTG